jgi:membrane peptidoglycan carboxypeptidase
MVGYTPSISTSVWMGSDTNQPIVTSAGKIIYGSGLPGAIWQQFMNAVLKGTPKEKLPDKALIQGDTGQGVPDPTTSAPPSSSARTTQQAPATTTDNPAPGPTAPTSTTTPSSTTTTAPGVSGPSLGNGGPPGNGRPTGSPAG